MFFFFFIFHCVGFCWQLRPKRLVGNYLVSLKGVGHRSPLLNVSRADQCEKPREVPRTEQQIYRWALHPPSPHPPITPFSPTTSLWYFLFNFDDSGSQMDSYWVLWPRAEPSLSPSGGEKLLVVNDVTRKYGKAAGEWLLSLRPNVHKSASHIQPTSLKWINW